MIRLKLNRALMMLFIAGCINMIWGQSPTAIQTGADQMPVVISKLTGKRIGLMVNQTAIVGKSHLVDSLMALKMDIRKIFSPEHGFRGNADAGEHVKDAVDAQTGIPVISLYGGSKKPTPQHLEDVDILLFDIQDVGVRFYTYITSLHYLMEACAENNKKLIVLDRPNPNGSYVDGPVLKKEMKSFVGMHPIPIVHGMSIGEYALMINGEGWLEGGKKCELEIVQVKNWKHSDPYSLPIKPSPNLPNDHAIALYPSTCMFEGTALSVGRGTQNPFEWIGHPDLKKYSFQFTPVSIEGMDKKPLFENQVCYGLDLRKVDVKKQFDLSYVMELYQAYPDKENFFKKYFTKLAGTKDLQEQIIKGMTEKQIRSTWSKDISAYMKIRKKYLLYP